MADEIPYTQELQVVLQRSNNVAYTTGDLTISSHHFLLSSVLEDDNLITDYLFHSEFLPHTVVKADLIKAFQWSFVDLKTSPTTLPYSSLFKKVMEYRTPHMALKHKRVIADSLDVLISILQVADSPAARFLEKYGYSADRVIKERKEFGI